ncbi:MAG: substrate-binding domain-containing protein [Xanthomonadaceae bacterium]|nr:substrate-binding domain-containing protein [Xanthomonadaceae bacterium]
MSVRAVRLLPALLFGACLAAPAFAATKPTHHPVVRHKAPVTHKASRTTLIWRGDVATGRAVMDNVAKAWERSGHGRIVLQPFNTASGIDAVAGGTADIAGSARPSDGTPENARLTFTPVAWDGLVMIANPSNPIRNLTARQLHEIYLGYVRNWKDVGGRDAPIDLYAVISPNDGVEYSLRSLLFGRGDQQISASRYYLNTDALEQGVALDPNALGVSTLADVIGNRKLRTIPIDNVAPTLANVANGSYPLYAPLYLVSNPNSSKAAAVQDFLDYLQTHKAKAALRSHMVLPYQDGIALAAEDQQRRDKVFDEATASTAKAPVVPPIAAPGATYAAASAIAPTSQRTADARAALDSRNAANARMASASGTGSASSHATASYTVVKGDTLSVIAERHGVTVADLRTWNHLKNDNIRLGQSLRISSN